MSAPIFAITRADGRSNLQVVLDLVRGADPGTTYTYAQLGAALTTGTDRPYGVVAVRRIVAAAYDRLLRDQQRALRSVRGVGYRLALAAEHTPLALDRKRRADVQMRRGLLTLQHVRLEEMDANSRAAHTATWMMVSALWQNQQALEHRQTKVELALEELRAQQKAQG